MYRVGILLKKGGNITKNCDTKELCEDFILEQIDKLAFKRSVIVNMEDLNEIYTENYIRKENT